MHHINMLEQIRKKEIERRKGRENKRERKGVSVCEREREREREKQRERKREHTFERTHFFIPAVKPITGDIELVKDTRSRFISK